MKKEIKMSNKNNGFSYPFSLKAKGLEVGSLFNPDKKKIDSQQFVNQVKKHTDESKTKVFVDENGRPYGAKGRTYVKDKAKKSKVIERRDVIPDSLIGKVTQEEWSMLNSLSFEGSELIYKNTKEKISAVNDAMQQILGDEKFLPYITEPEKFKLLCTMLLEDMGVMNKELNSIRSLYTQYLDENGQPKLKRTEYEKDAYFLELLADINLRYYVCNNRIKNILKPSLQHLSDFYTTMKINYYAQPEHFDDAPLDIKDFIKYRLPSYTNLEIHPEQVENTNETAQEDNNEQSK